MNQKQRAYERVKAYMANSDGWVTPTLIERDFRTETPKAVIPLAREIAAAFKQLCTDDLCERAPTGKPYGQPQFKYRRLLVGTCSRCHAPLNNVSPGFSVTKEGAVCSGCLRPGEELLRARGM